MWKCLPKDQVFCLMSSFSIVEASALIAGHPPSDYKEQFDWNGNPDGTFYLENSDDHARTVFYAALNSITHSIELNELRAIIKTSTGIQLFKTDTQDDWQAKATIDIFETRVKRDDLVYWLKSRHCYPDFFFNNNNSPEYLNRDSHYYAPKLAALIEAWKEVKKAHIEDRLTGTVKQHAEQWLENNARNYGVDNVTKFKDLAAIVNFEPEGGRKATLDKSKPTPTNLDGDGSTQNNGEKTSISDSLFIQKSDLKDDSYTNNRFTMHLKDDDSLPF